MALRFGWGVADQAVSSLENFLLGVFVARTLGAASLGALGIAMLVYALVVNISRGMSSDPLMVRFTGAANERWRAAVGPAVGAAFCVGLAIAPACLLVGLGLLAAGGPELGETGKAFVMLGLLLPGLTVQDCWRYVFFSVGRGAQAFVNDALWTVLLILAFLVGEPLGLGGIEWAMGCFGGTACVAAAFGSFQARVLPRPMRARRWVRSQRDLTTRFVYTNLTAGIGGQLRPFIVALFAGLAAAGAIRGGQMLVGPALALLMGIAQVAVPETVRALAVSRRAFWRLCMAISGSLAVLSAAWGIVIMLVFPHGFGTLVLGDVWEATAPLMLPIVIGATAGCLQIGPSAGVRALGRADLSLRVQLFATVLSIGACAAGAFEWGAQGAVWGTAMASAISAAVWWACLRSATTAHGAAAVSAPTEEPRIVIATLMRERGATGVQTHLRTVRDYVEGVGGDCCVITPFTRRSLLRNPLFAGRYLVRPFRLSLGMWWYVTWHSVYLARGLRRELRKGGNVVIYAQCPVAASVALRVRTHQPVVLVTHFNVSLAEEWANQGDLKRGGRIYREIRQQEERALAGVDGLVHVSAFSRRLLEERIPALRSIRTVVIPNFVEVIQPRPIARRRGDLVTIGGLEPRKNHQYLIDVLAEAAQEGHRYTLSIIGAGSGRAALEERARRRGVDDLVTFLGYLPNPRVAMSGHRVYCHAARLENLPLSLLEAMGAGLPVAAGAVGGIPEIIRNGHDGILWPLDNAAEAAHLLIGVLENEDRRARMSNSASERIREAFTTEKVAPRLVEFLCGRARGEMVETR